MSSRKFKFLMYSCEDSLSSERRRESERRSREDSSKLRAYLKTVLNAISNRHKQLGYVQGLNYWVKHMY